ncbi:Uncharacterised protein [Mycobacterium tuberculosis]|nr:Uncharacterised protein [Mycobacterium tuberculosis]
MVDGVSVCSVRSWPAWRMVSWVPGPSPRMKVTSVWLASTISRKPRHRSRNRSREMPSGSCGSMDRMPSSSRRPPKPTTSAVQAPASEAMCRPSRVLRCRSRRSIRAAS